MSGGVVTVRPHDAAGPDANRSRHHTASPDVEAPLAISPAVLGARLRATRIATGQSQEEIAWTARISQAALSKYETGRCEISLATFIRLCRALKIDPIDILRVE